MRKVNLIWISALFLIVYSLSVNALNNCTPSACSSGYSDNGIICDGSICYRNCSIHICDSTWTQVSSNTIGWEYDGKREEDDTT
ncbi:MAG: hypothetical protein ABIJ08_02935 [Nanoarchaeota archaeon]